MRHSISLSSPFDALITRDPVVRRIVIQLRGWASRARGILLTGEAGVGKSLAARLVHLASPRPDAVFLVCSAPTELLQVANRWATLREKGGTMVVDLVERWSVDQQAEVFSRLSPRPEAPFRIIATSRMSQARLRDEARLHEGLAQWWDNRSVDLPPLRARPEDLAPIVDAMIHRLLRRAIRIEPATWQALHAHGWPDNIRGLRRVLDDALPRLVEDRLRPEHLVLNPLEPPSLQHLADRSFAEMRNTVEAWYLRRLLEQTHGNISEAARRAECSRKVLRDRLRRHGLYRSMPGPIEGPLETTASYARETAAVEGWPGVISMSDEPSMRERSRRAREFLLQAGVLVPRRSWPWPPPPRGRRSHA